MFLHFFIATIYVLMKFVGLIPAGGFGSRLGNLPFSKEVFPEMSSQGEISVISSNLIRYFKQASINNIFFIIRKGKWDIPNYFGDGTLLGVNIGYLMMNLSYGTPFTLNQAYPFIKDCIVGLGFPDIVFQPEDAFVHLRDKLLKSKCDVVLGVVPYGEYLKSDMIEFGDDGKISDIVIKQNRPDLKYGWFIALWRPSFTTYMYNYLDGFLRENPSGRINSQEGVLRELFVGDVIRSAISSGMDVDYVLFPEGNYIDLGTPEAIANRYKSADKL